MDVVQYLFINMQGKIYFAERNLFLFLDLEIPYLKMYETILSEPRIDGKQIVIKIYIILKYWIPFIFRFLDTQIME